MSEPPPHVPIPPLFADHPRSWCESRYVYPVISRRSRGLSIGVNLNPDKACNFDCVYCQVDRSGPAPAGGVDPDVLAVELERTLGAALSGRLFDEAPFEQVPTELRRINDIAFSGDGEPTTSPEFLSVVRGVGEIKRRLGLDDVKIVLITDAAYLEKPQVRQALAVMDDNNGEIWAKLDAGTDRYYRLINRPNVPFETVLANILAAARVRPVVIQSLWMYVHDEPPPDDEIGAFGERLRSIVEQGGAIGCVQVYTIARRTTEPWVMPLPDDALEAIAARVRATAHVPVAVYST